MIDPIDAYVGKRVKEARRVVGLSQTLLGQMIGRVAFQQVQKYEKGTNRISASRLFKIAAAVGKPVEWFFEEAPAYSVPVAQPVEEAAE
jgi:transcriptional regulator with XRE-family HTH domain